MGNIGVSVSSCLPHKPCGIQQYRSNIRSHSLILIYIVCKSGTLSVLQLLIRVGIVQDFFSTTVLWGSSQWLGNKITWSDAPGKHNVIGGLVSHGKAEVMLKTPLNTIQSINFPIHVKNVLSCFFLFWMLIACYIKLYICFILILFPVYLFEKLSIMLLI